jgi:transglutaminase-like putative cysteine protease
MTNNTPLSVREVSWIVVALLLALVPHMQRFPILLSLAFLGAALWRVLGAMDRFPLPDRRHLALWLAKQAVAVAAFIAVYIAYHGQLGREAGVELLAALLGLKLLEMRNARDYYITAFLCYFLIVTNFFYSQTIVTAFYMLGVVLVVTALLIQFNTPNAYRSTRSILSLSALMTAQAAPLMLISFVLFPRVPGPLWGLPQDAFGGVTGLSNEMRVGEIARLGLSDEIAFRVSFAGAEPRARDRYWRGPVLWTTDGKSWAGGAAGEGTASAIEARGPTYDYRITLEPHHIRWLLGLEMTTSAEPDMRRTADHSLLAQRIVRRRMSYNLSSVLDYRVRGLSAKERAAALQLPAGWHPRAVALARQWVQSQPKPGAIVERALAFFSDQEFYYSLTPPLLPDDPVDQFLFETREGFCEHFASSFVVLMRAAGIPARIVTGYQGGEYNTVADYMTVRQRDAHAWAEVYLAEDGWVRVDPTAAVAPERVSLGFDTVMPRRSSLSAIDPDGVASAFWAGIRDSFDAMTYTWNQWVLGYTPQRQRRLLESFGFEDWETGDLVLALTLLLALAGVTLAVLLVRTERNRPDLAHQAWLEFCAKLARHGLERRASEAPHIYAHRVILARADLAAEVSQITRLYTQTRYSRVPLDPKRLLRRVRRFKPRRRR